jgi:hypothetical protein
MEFAGLDATYFSLTPTIAELLESHLAANIDVFIKVIS